MGYKTAPRATEFCNLLVSLAVIATTLSPTKSLDITNITTTRPLPAEPSSCFFPNFLQTSCLDSTRVCHWTLGKRIALQRWINPSAPSEFRAIRGTSEWTWSVVNSTIVIQRTDAPYSQPLVKITHRVFTCVKEINHGNDTFLVSKKEVLEETQNVTFSCIQFFQRGPNVVQYKLGTWKNKSRAVDCRDNGLYFDESLLIADYFHGLLDCPLELQGAFDIVNIYDAKRERNCRYDSGSFGTFESDCVNKEGIYIDFGTEHNCTKPDIGYHHPSDLSLHCHSKTWNDGNLTYFIAARRARWSHEYEKTSFHCIAYEISTARADEFELHIFNEAICKHLDNDGFLVRLRRKKSESSRKHVLTGRCIFPKEFQGSWIEHSNQNGNNKISIRDSNVTIHPYGSFECKDRLSSRRDLFQACDRAGMPGQWSGPGWVRFYYDDYTLVRGFANGCRPRITRLGLTSTENNRVAMYRLSQSEPIVADGRTPDEYYRLEILKRFCANMAYLYTRDPFPYWGRNIDKVIYRAQLPGQPISKCSLAVNSKQSLLSTVAYSESTACQGKVTSIYFGCKGPQGAMETVTISYAPECKRKRSVFACVGKALRSSHFVLLRDTATHHINCIWFDKESNAILRLNSSQCSDVDWGRLPGHGVQYSERFNVKYFDKCPFVADPTVRLQTKSETSANRVMILSLWLPVAILLTLFRGLY